MALVAAIRKAYNPLDTLVGLWQSHLVTNKEATLSPNIRVDEDVYAYLQDRGKPFVDTPNSVLRRLLGLEEDEGEAGARDGAKPTLLTSARTQRKKRRTASRTRGRRPKRAPRAPAGSLLPEDEYVQPILKALADRGGTAPARDVINSVGVALKSRLTNPDKDRLASGSIRWENRVQFVRLRLIEEGLLAKDSPRGVWALTDLGRARLRDTG